jgi:hypothetical protein
MAAERALRIGKHNPAGPSAPPLYRLTALSRGANWSYGGNVFGGSGVELTTEHQLPLLGIDRLAP